MAEDKPVPLPLNGEEVQEAILYKIAESLTRTCHLKHDNAYTSFKAEISIKLTLSDYGREVKDNHSVGMAEYSGLPAENAPRSVDANVTIEPAPPNQVRVDTDQEVPVVTNEGGKRVVRKHRYAARKSKTGQTA